MSAGRVYAKLAWPQGLGGACPSRGPSPPVCPIVPAVEWLGQGPWSLEKTEGLGLPCSCPTLVCKWV